MHLAGFHCSTCHHSIPIHNVYIFPSHFFVSNQCKMIAPIYENLSKQYPDVAFGKIDVDNNQNSASEFHISAVPTFVFSKGKEAVNKFSGADKVQLEKLVKEL